VDRTSREVSVERAFREALGVEVSENGNALGHDSVPVLYEVVGPVYAVLR
jgi:hypothetical protein